MNNATQPKRNPMPNGNTSEPAPAPVQVQAKVSYAPMMIATALTTLVAVGVTFAFTRYIEKKKEEKELEKERTREDQAAMNPAMPMMWPGMSASQAPQGNGQESKLEQLSDRLDGWERGLREREQVLGAREHHLSLVMGGGGQGSEE